MSYETEGFDAFQSGIAHKDNPYKYGTAGRKYWNIGWNNASNKAWNN